ncbi:putative ester cyclase [Bradyrhizobium sp. LA6.10]
MPVDLKQIYRDYIECLNEQAWSRLGKFVAEEVVHNNNLLGLSGYRECSSMITWQFPTFASNRLRFDCFSPTGVFLGLPVNAGEFLFTRTFSMNSIATR